MSGYHLDQALTPQPTSANLRAFGYRQTAVARFTNDTQCEYKFAGGHLATECREDKKMAKKKATKKLKKGKRIEKTNTLLKIKFT